MSTAHSLISVHNLTHDLSIWRKNDNRFSSNLVLTDANKQFNPIVLKPNNNLSNKLITVTCFEGVSLGAESGK